MCGGCSDLVGPAPVPVPDVPVELLVGAPELVEFDGHTFALGTNLWRDFMPMSPPGGTGLLAMVTLSEVDSLDIPSDIDLGYVWVLKDDEIWAAAFVEPQPPGWPPHVRVRVARDGPKWGPFIHVDVVAGILAGDDSMFLLAARDQWIARTD